MMKYFASLLLMTMLLSCSPSTMQEGRVEFVGEPGWTIFQAEEWEGYKEKYLRTFGKLTITGAVQNVGMGEAKNVILMVELHEDEHCTTCLYEGKSLVCPRLSAGVIHEFCIVHKFEYTKQCRARGVKLSVSND